MKNGKRKKYGEELQATGGQPGSGDRIVIVMDRERRT